MQLTMEQLPDGVEKIALSGRMDTEGALEIDNRLAFLASTRPARIIVELSEVSFLASIGIRTLVTSAKALSRRGGRMVLASPQPMVGEVLKLACIDSFIPVYADVGTACDVLRTFSGTGLNATAEAV